MFLQGDILFSLSFFQEVQVERIDWEFPKTFYGGYLFELVEYLWNCRSKNENKTIH